MAGKSGSCFCGKLRYEYTGEPVMNATCHCLTCRKLTGSAYTTNICLAETQFHLVSGTPKVFDWTHESGMAMHISFCGDCGVNIYKTAESPAFAGLIIVQAGTLDDQDALEQAAPGAELYVKNRAKWIPALVGRGQMQEFV